MYYNRKDERKMVNTNHWARGNASVQPQSAISGGGESATGRVAVAVKGRRRQVVSTV